MSLILAMRTPAPKITPVSPVDAVVVGMPVNKTYEAEADLKEYNCSGIFNARYLSMCNQMVTSEITRAFCHNSNNFPRL